MKYILITFTAILFSGCIKRQAIEFTGTAPGIKDGVFIVKTTGDSTIYGVNIKDGKFSLPKTMLKEPGYYSMNIVNNEDTVDKHGAFDVYLESGKYNIETVEGKLYKYPKITSTSKIQQQLSAFYTLLDNLSTQKKNEADSINVIIKTKGNGMAPNAYTKLLNKLSTVENSMVDNNVTAFREFLKAYPNSDASAHLMSKLNYEDDPVSFYAIYKTLSPAAKNSDDGKEIGEKLSHLVKLVVGLTAPAIVGNMPDGKPFDPKTITKKYVLIDFWKAGNDFSRRNHGNFADLLADKEIRKDLEVVSVSLDKHENWWTDAITQDKLTWPQVSDLKGDDSPNAVNWNISIIPTYYLLDKNWKIIEPNIPISRVNFEVNDYITKHP